jgi:predicted nucleic-acid-binding protein
MMVGVDTNILVRYLSPDTPHEYEAARALLEGFTSESPGFISIPTIVELVWVMHKRYKIKRDEIVRSLLKLLRDGGLVFDRVEYVADAVSRFQTGRADFADYMIEQTCRLAGCTKTLTFDQDAASCAGMTLLPDGRDQKPIDSPAPSSVSTPSTAKMIAAIP